MDESVSVRPRFVEGEVQQVQVVQNVPQASEKGIFTSLYENKIIILIIVISIVIIGIIAYMLIYNKTAEDCTSNPKSATCTTQKLQSNEQNLQNKKDVQPASSSKDDKRKLMTLYSKVKEDGIGDENNTQTVENSTIYNQASQSNVNQQTHNTEDKTDDEIMQLMEDLHDEVEETEKTVIEQPAEEGSMSDGAHSTGGQDNMCSATVSSGRACRNRARSGGKCQRHGG